MQGRGRQVENDARRAFHESIAPRHHGWTRVADAPITASLRGCAFRPVTTVVPVFFFFPSHGWRRPCWGSLHATSSACFLSGGLIARTYFVWKFFSSGVFLRCVIGFLRNVSRAIFQIAMGGTIRFHLLRLAGSTSSSKQMDWISGSTGTEEPDYTYRCEDPRKRITLTSYSAWCFHMCLFDVSDRRTS